MAAKAGLKISRKHIPDDVYRIVLARQAEVKAKCKCSYNIEQTIYKLIRLAKDIPL